MKKQRYSLLFSCAGIFLLAVIAERSWPQLEVLRLDLSSFGRECHATAAYEESFSEIDARNAVVQNRISIKNQICNDLIGGEITFLEAAARFKQTYRFGPRYTPEAFQFIPGKTLDERYCCEVIQWVQSRISNVPDQKLELLLARMNRELEERLASPAGLRVPDVE